MYLKLVLFVLLYTKCSGFCSTALVNIKCITGCKNGGTCEKNVIACTIKCTCAPGYTGTTCNTTLQTPKNTTQNPTNLTDSSTAPINETRVTLVTDSSQITTHSVINIVTPWPYKVCPKTGVHCYNGDCTGGGNKECICHKYWQGLKCTDLCNLECGVGGCLVLKESGTTVTQNGLPKMFCNCPGANETHGYDSNCTSYKKTTLPPIIRTVPVKAGNDYWIPLGISLGVLVLFVVAFIVTFVTLWKNKAVFILKIVYKFRSYEDNDEREYDAFISYKSSASGDTQTSSPEELFVINTLLPKLENEFHFKVCVHFRDFLGGLSISDNVLKAIESSHRTIMLISRSYVSESIWTRFEYEQAQVAVLEQKQRIIPILFDDISDLDIQDKTLKLIMKSTTYLERPQDPNDEKKQEEFWTRVRLSMPKKRRAESIEMTSLGIINGDLPKVKTNGVKIVNGHSKNGDVNKNHHSNVLNGHIKQPVLDSNIHTISYKTQHKPAILDSNQVTLNYINYLEV